MKLRTTLIIAGLSLVILAGISFALVNVSKTGSVLSISSSRSNGTMYFDGPHDVAISQPFTLKVMMDSHNQNANAAGIYLRFDPERLQINDMNTLNSFCQFYPEKKFDNRLGLVSLACGSPNPGFKGVTTLVELQITPLVIGTTTIETSSNSQLLLSDGKGTNILKTYPAWEVQIGAGM